MQTTTRYTLRIEGADQLFTAATMTEAREEARRRILRGEWDTSNGTIWVDAWILWEGGEESLTVAIDPPAPKCSDGTRKHDWRVPFEVLGGDKRNPGVRGNGGGIIAREVCAMCGQYEERNTWAQRPDTGEQGLVSVRYLPADEASRAWCLDAAAE